MAVKLSTVSLRAIQTTTTTLPKQIICFEGYNDEMKCNFAARADLWIIGQAWRLNVSFEKEADGFGAGLGTCGGDWSGIRDSSEEAIEHMQAKAARYFDVRGIVGVQALINVCQDTNLERQCYRMERLEATMNAIIGTK